MPEKDDKTVTASETIPSSGGRRTAGKDSERTEQAAPSTEELAVDPQDPPIDPRLDNRTGDQRPKLEDFPAKPQQIDGPEIGEEREHARRVARRADQGEVGGPRKGAKSPGPHGLGDTADQV
ncbi:hypothetical protein ABZ508_02595 [Streptomyces lavendulocolor]|uniref:Uncharacterized protein n=1 Tax=Streptomyces lavendulocolor TaxID=67316 RepID=A0ABV2VY83_9ACTN